MLLHHAATFSRRALSTARVRALSTTNTNSTTSGEGDMSDEEIIQLADQVMKGEIESDLEDALIPQESPSLPLGLPDAYLTGMSPQTFDKNGQRSGIKVHPKTGAKEFPHPTPTLHEPLSQKWAEKQMKHGWSVPITTEAQTAWEPPERVFWGSDFDVYSLSLSYDDVVNEREAADMALTHAYTHGILVVTGTPPGNDPLRNIARAFTGGHTASGDADPDAIDHGPMRTLYGEIWSTSSSAQSAGASTADSAYTSLSLPLHTDMTYMKCPPGLQIFSMTTPASDGSGKSTYLDGFNAAESLRESNAFALLSGFPYSFRSIDRDNGWHLETTGTVFETCPYTDTVSMIRHNDLDSLSALPPYYMALDMAANIQHAAVDEDEVAAFYSAAKGAMDEWDEVLADPNRKISVPLKAGDTTIVHNHRVLHGRESFNLSDGTSRTITGCYTSAEDLLSRWRVMWTKPLS